MKRDMELIRKMVLTVEDAPDGYAPDLIPMEGYSDEQVAYHAWLIIQAGLATGPITTCSGNSGPTAQILNLTWDGHEFAAMARDDTAWNKTMGIVREKGGAVTLDVMKALLTQVVKAGLGLIV
jgi:hypothetical protein